jgi:Mn-dependent DtxR family transcriptional regulator
LPDDAQLREIERRLARLDRASRHGPWTRAVLRTIHDQPEVRAADLALQLGRERLSFKLDVRKLKELGLTESLPRGYRLSPRGQRVVAALGER